MYKAITISGEEERLDTPGRYFFDELTVSLEEQHLEGNSRSEKESTVYLLICDHPSMQEIGIGYEQLKAIIRAVDDLGWHGIYDDLVEVSMSNN